MVHIIYLSVLLSALIYIVYNKKYILYKNIIMQSPIRYSGSINTAI